MCPEWTLRALAGAGGFEPPYGGIKIHCLTTWRRPNGRKTKEVAGSFRIPVSRQRRSIDAVQLFQQGRSAKIPLNTAPANCPTARGAVAGRFHVKRVLTGALYHIASYCRPSES